MTDRHPFGVDFGGTAIKGAMAELGTGALASKRAKIDTPRPATPDKVVEVVERLLHEAGAHADTPVGVTIPAVVVHGSVESAANIDRSWIGTDADGLFSSRLGRHVTVLNDADAAGLAEVRYGAAKGQDGLVIMTTLGTGIGSALIFDGVLVPNSELGHLEVEGKDAESRAANSVREEKDLSWDRWARRLTTYYRTLERLFSPELFVVGGGVSKSAERFMPLVEIDTPIVAATLLNTAGIVGAALVASERAGHRGPARPV